MPQTRSGKTYVAPRTLLKTKVKTKVKTKTKTKANVPVSHAANERSNLKTWNVDLPLVELNPTRAQLKRLSRLEKSIPEIIQREMQKKRKDEKAMPRKVLFKIFIAVCLIMGIAALSNTSSILDYIHGICIRLAVSIPGHMGSVLKVVANYGLAIGDIVGRKCTKSLFQNPMRLDLALKRSLIENYHKPIENHTFRTGLANSYTFPMMDLK